MGAIYWGNVWRTEDESNKVRIKIPILKLHTLPPEVNRIEMPDFTTLFDFIKQYTNDDYLVGANYNLGFDRVAENLPVNLFYSPFANMYTLNPGATSKYHILFQLEGSPYLFYGYENAGSTSADYLGMTSPDLSGNNFPLRLVSGDLSTSYSNFCVIGVVYDNLPLSGDEEYCIFSVDISDRWFRVSYGNDVGELYDSVPQILAGLEPGLETSDPFEPGGETTPGGGGGSFDNTSTPIDIPGLPSISAASTGFISLFNPSLSQLNDLASYLWSDLFEIDGWKKLFANPMDAILGLSILPVAIPSGGIREVKVGNIGTGVSLTIAASQFVEVDCGSIDVNEYWGAYLDYEPYTQAQIFLPYIGTRPISVDEIMGKTVRVVYHVDILTGACCCFVKCGESVLYTYNGQCSIPIPITSANYTSVVNGVISVAASVGSLVATGGTSAPTAIPAIATSVVNQMKPQIEKSGSISGSAGVLNMQIPYLILIRPRQALPSRQNEFIGYPSLITVQLTELSGYTEVQSIHLENIPATQEELAEIQSLLSGGVIF